MSTPPFSLNPRVAAVRPSATLAMTARTKELQRQGRPVIGLSAGEPDFVTPAPISEAGIQAIRDGYTHYTENAGMLELRRKICEKLEKDNGLSYTPEQILCSNGAKQSVALTIESLCRPGDEILIPAPFWVSYPEMVRLSGANPVSVPTTVESNYRLSPEALEAAITENTRMLILCSPSNPTGSAYTPAELEALAEVLRRHEQVFVLSDEIYEYILFEGEHVSIASLPGMKERTITVNGFSKAYAMTGWRLGYLAAELPIVKAASNIQSQVTSAPSTISQKAGIAALEMSREPVEEMVAAFRERRDFMVERLSAIEGVRCPRPEGAFYLFPEVSGLVGKRTPSGKILESGDDVCFYILEECNVALVQGSAFGEPNGVRFSYAASMDDLKEAMRRIEEGIAALR